MHLFNSANQRKVFLEGFFKIILALVLIQLARAVVMGSLWFIFGSSKDNTLFQFFNGLSILIVGVALILIFRPTMNELGINWDDLRFKTRILYLSGILFLIFMALTTYTFTWEVNQLVLGLVFGILTPAFEELLFRGYIWGKIQKTSQGANQNVLTWITVTLLFSIWHLGYLDVFLIHPLGVGNLTMILVSKLAIGMVLGLIVGYARLKTGKTYASFILHGLWNVMAP
jgi:CAAX protease family protein